MIAFAFHALSAPAEPVQHGNLRVSFIGKLSPDRLPRQGTRGVTVTVGGRLATTDGSQPPQLRRIDLAINRHGHIDYRGLPVCRLDDIQPSTTAKALRACGDARVGEGLFFADVSIPGQAPFPSRGRLIAFNGVLGCGEQRTLHAGRLWPSSSRTQGGRGGERAPARDPNPSDRGQRDAKCHSLPVIFAHVYGTDPLPTSYTVPFAIGHGRGAFGTTLSASLPRVTGKAGFITGLRLSLHRDFRYRGRRHSYLSAGCPAPAGIKLATFDFLRASFGFSGRALSTVLRRTCRAQG